MIKKKGSMRLDESERQTEKHNFSKERKETIKFGKGRKKSAKR